VRIAIVGVGGAAGYFGGRLAAAGEDVLLVARGAHLEAIQRDGLRVDSDRGDFRVHPARAAASLEGQGAFDAAILGVKAWQVREIAPQLAGALVAEDAFALPLQNGVGALTTLAEALGPSRVMGGLCRVNSARVAPGHIRQAGVEPTVIFGELDGGDTPRARALGAALERAGIAVERPPDIRAAIWQKFLLVAGWGAVAALARAPIGVLREVPETRELLRRALAEVHAVSVAEGIRLPAQAAEATLAYIDTLPPGLTISLQRDVEAGLPSEIDDCCGEVVRRARAHGLAAPVQEMACMALAALEGRARGRLSF